MKNQDSPFSRRAFIAAGLTLPVAAEKVSVQSQTEAPDSSSALNVDFEKLVSQSDLIYGAPVARSEEGLPIGNGRMGSLVWTSPTALRFQINRVDIYASDSHTNSFPERHSDYCGGCGFVDIDFGAPGEDVFPETGFRQHLSLYDALLTAQGNGVTTRVLAWNEQDVVAIDIDDRRPEPQPITVSLRMLRYLAQYFGGDLETFARDHVVQVQTRSHTARSQLIVRGNRIVLKQEFREGDFYSTSAVAIGFVGREAEAQIAHETEVRLSGAPGNDPCTCLIASAASFDSTEDIVGSALQQLEEAASRGFGRLLQSNRKWWGEFWSRGFVHLHSGDGQADYVQQNYNYYLYLMASSSRGKFPPKFNGMIWNTGGDLRTWGAQHWFANLSCYYEALPASNRLELLDPVFDMYSGMYDASSVAARQQWGSKGMFIPETAHFNGLAKLPDDIAKEMRDLYLLRKPWDQRSARFREFASTKQPHSSRWNWSQGGEWVDGHWVGSEKGNGAFGHVVHILGTTAKVAYLYWRRYEFTLDKEWLQNRAYPMLKGAAEFYRNFPNLKKGHDGKYHIHHVNSNESVLGARDTDEDLSAMRGVLAAVIRASEILGEDAALRSTWREFLDNLAPLPVSDNPEALKPERYGGPRVWVRGLKPAIQGGRGLLPDPNSLPMWFFDLCVLESNDPETLQLANATFDSYFRDGISADTPVSVLSKLAIAASTLGRAAAARFLIPNQMRALRQERDTAYKGGGVLANRMTLREGPQAIDAQRLGRAAEALHLALLQSNAPAPAEDPVIRVFPACPKAWNAEFTLLARGGFLVTSAMRDGNIEFVELRSLAGARCRLRNPWHEKGITFYREGRRAEDGQGAVVEFETAKDERILLIPRGSTPPASRRRIPVR